MLSQFIKLSLFVWFVFRLCVDNNINELLNHVLYIIGVRIKFLELHIEKNSILQSIKINLFMWAILSKGRIHMASCSGLIVLSLLINWGSVKCWQCVSVPSYDIIILKTAFELPTLSMTTVWIWSLCIWPMEVKVNLNTNLKAGFKGDSLLLFCYTGGGEDDSFVLPTQCHGSLDLLILRQHPPKVKGQLAGRPL